jgi:hypothetical protein
MFYANCQIQSPVKKTYFPCCTDSEMRGIFDTATLQSMQSIINTAYTQRSLQSMSLLTA